MFDAAKLKTFAFGAAAISMIWMGFGLKNKSDYLSQANLQIDSARTLLYLIKTDLSEAKKDVDSTRLCLKDMRIAANAAKGDLANLQKERENIYKNIDATIENSRKTLKKQENSMTYILNKQKAMLDSLNAIPIRNIVIKSSKENEINQ